MNITNNFNKPLGFSNSFKFINPHRKIVQKYYSQGLKVSVESETQSPKEYFIKNGYLVVENLFNPKELYCPVPEERGKLVYHGSYDNFQHLGNEPQVLGSLARYSYPKYKEIHSYIRLILEDILDDKLYNTYYYDRFYFRGQRLPRHIDRDSCEISVSVQVSSNFMFPWPFGLKTLQEEEVAIELQDGWGLIYMGCDVEHWRDPLSSRYNKLGRFINKIIRKPDNSYWHQIFFHYVRANGNRSHFSGDMLDYIKS
jgi:hypothetical protein